MKNTIILTVHNKEKTIVSVLIELIKNTSEKTERIIIILEQFVSEIFISAELVKHLS